MKRFIAVLNEPRTIHEYVVYAQFVVESVATDPIFVSPWPPIAVLLTDVGALRAATAASLSNQDSSPSRGGCTSSRARRRGARRTTGSTRPIRRCGSSVGARSSPCSLCDGSREERGAGKGSGASNLL